MLLQQDPFGELHLPGIDPDKVDIDVERDVRLTCDSPEVLNTMDTPDTIRIRGASFEEELIELLCNEQEWVDAVFDDIIGRLDTFRTIPPKPPTDSSRHREPAASPTSHTAPRPSEVERSPPTPTGWSPDQFVSTSITVLAPCRDGG